MGVTLIPITHTDFAGEPASGPAPFDPALRSDVAPPHGVGAVGTPVQRFIPGSWAKFLGILGV
jgi:hypothetical protein